MANDGYDHGLYALCALFGGGIAIGLATPLAGSVATMAGLPLVLLVAVVAEWAGRRAAPGSTRRAS